MPFVRTAILGSPGSKVLPDGDVINHFNMIRVRVTGSGILRPTMYSMDDVNSSTLPTLTMAAVNQNVGESKSNFMQTRMSLDLRTNAIDEIFRISRITFYSRPVWASLPG